MEISRVRSTRSSAVSEKALLSSRCSGVAKWFTIPHLVIKLLEVLFAVALVVLMLVWQSKGVSIGDLTYGSINYRNYFYSYLGAAFLTMLYSIAMIIVGLGGFKIPASMRAIVAGAYLFLWMFMSALISAALEDFNNTYFTRSRDLNILLLQIANVLGFCILVVFLADIFLAFSALRAREEEKFAQRLADSSSFTSIAGGKHHVTGRGSYRRMTALHSKTEVPAATTQNVE